MDFVIWTQLGYIPSVLSLNAKLSQLVVGGSFILTVQTKRHQSSHLSLCRIWEWARRSKFSSKWKRSVSSRLKSPFRRIATRLDRNQWLETHLDLKGALRKFTGQEPSPAAETVCCFSGFPPLRSDYYVRSCWTEGRLDATVTHYHTEVQSGMTRQDGQRLTG